MARLVDLFCPCCGHVAEDHNLSMAHDTARLHCPRCNRTRSFAVLCNGGAKSRARVNDWPAPWSPFWEGQAKTYGAEAYHDDEAGERPVVRPDGTAVKLDQDRSADRRDRRRHKLKTRRGQNPIFIDQRRRL